MTEVTWSAFSHDSWQGLYLQHLRDKKSEAAVGVQSYLVCTGRFFFSFSEILKTRNFLVVQFFLLLPCKTVCLQLSLFALSGVSLPQACSSQSAAEIWGALCQHRLCFVTVKHFTRKYWRLIDCLPPTIPPLSSHPTATLWHGGMRAGVRAVWKTRRGGCVR